ncbi:MAG: translocation/assembly module TamB domain-containing protein [Bacteroidales bacterium]|nr:translocation/assembly module TamB domain-containing protein [Bacteroidales bacterium]
MLLTIYVIVALLNYTLVQSVCGSYASDYVSRRSGGIVRIGSLSFDPFNHLVARDILLVSPDGDTVCEARRVSARFSEFPIDDEGLILDRVSVRDTRYHLKIDSTGLNLKYLIDCFKKEKAKREPHKAFKVFVGRLDLHNVTYVQDLKERPGHRSPENGVDIPHMEYRGIDARIKNIRVNKDNVTCRINDLSTVEKSGLEIRHIKMNVYVSGSGLSATNMDIETADSHIMGDVLLEYCSWKTMKHYVDSVKMTCVLRDGSYGGMKDASYWAPVLWGMDEKVNINGRFGGPVRDMVASGVHIAFGDESMLAFDGSITGLPGIDTTDMWVNIERLHTNYEDLAAVKHPGGPVMRAENVIKKLGTIDFKGLFEGRIRDFRVGFELMSDPGDLQGDVHLENRGGEMCYEGRIESERFGIRQLAPNEWVSQAGCNIKFSGRGLNPRTMTANLEGDLRNMTFKGVRFGDVVGDTAHVSMKAGKGVVTAFLKLVDKIGRLEADGGIKLREELVSAHCNVNAKDVDIKRLGFWKPVEDSVARVDARFHLGYENFPESPMSAVATVDFLRLHASTKKYNLGWATAELSEEMEKKHFEVRSGVLTLTGDGYCELNTFGLLFEKFVDDYIPHNLIGSSEHREQRDYSALADANFSIYAIWHDNTGLLETFLPQLEIADSSTLQVDYNFQESIKPIICSRLLRWGDVKMNNVYLSGAAEGGRYSVSMKDFNIFLGDAISLESVTLDLNSWYDCVLGKISWENDNPTIGDGGIDLEIIEDLSQTKILINNLSMVVGGREWKISDVNSEMLLVQGGFVADNLQIENGDDKLRVRAEILGEEDDEIVVSFEKFGLDVANAFIGRDGMDVRGTVDGNVTVAGLNDKPYISSDLTIDKLFFNGAEIGDAYVDLSWNKETDNLRITMTTNRLNPSEAGPTYSKPLKVDGYIDMSEEDPKLDFSNITIENMDFRAVEPFVRGTLDSLYGRIFANLELGGTMGHPIVKGDLNVKDGAATVKFLGVRYGFSDIIELDTNVLRLHNFRIFDNERNEAVVDGVVNYVELKDSSFNLTMRTDRLLCMNTNDSSLNSESYYGKIYASANGRISGNTKNLNVEINAKTLSGSKLTIPINDKRQISSVDYIHFYSENEDEVTSEDGEVVSLKTTNNTVSVKDISNRYALTINVETTPDLELHMPFEFSQVSADMQTSGNGTLTMSVGTGHPFTLTTKSSDYTLNGGKVSLDLLGVITREFSIKEGSTINFPGNVKDANFNINAVYSQRVNMSTLTGSLSATGSDKPIVVNSIIALTGTLQKPEIGFDIELPDVDQSVEEEVFTYIDRTDERVMLEQTVSLLVRNKFYNSSSSRVSNQNEGTLVDEGYELLVNQLGSIVKGIVSVVDLNFDYKAANELRSEQYTMGLSREWTKFYFETTVGFGGEAREMSGVNNSGYITGEVGYKINPNLHLFVFNRSNTNDYTRSDLPYKQGVGLKLTKDFDTFGELFRRNKTKKK